jgi:DNA recombination protein RmuC
MDYLLLALIVFVGLLLVVLFVLLWARLSKFSQLPDQSLQTMLLQMSELRRGIEDSRSESNQRLSENVKFMVEQSTGLTERFEKKLTETTSSFENQLREIRAQVDSKLAEGTRLFQSASQTMGTQLETAYQRMQESSVAVQKQLSSLDERAQKLIEIEKDISELQNILKPPKLRGILGELLLQDLLQQILPPKFFTMQYRYKTGEIVDAMIHLQDFKVPVDSKFPLEAFRAMLSSQSGADVESARRDFLRDVRKHIDDIAAKYVRPEEGTINYAFMYIPAENVYYELIVRDAGSAERESVQAYAFKRKVIPTSPNSFYAYLMVILLGLNRLEISRRAEEIITHLAAVRTYLDRFREDFRVLGKHLHDAGAKYGDSARELDRLESRVESLAHGTSPDALAPEAQEQIAEGEQPGPGET